MYIYKQEDDDYQRHQQQPSSKRMPLFVQHSYSSSPLCVNHHTTAHPAMMLL